MGPAALFRARPARAPLRGPEDRPPPAQKERGGDIAAAAPVIRGFAPWIRLPDQKVTFTPA